MKRKVIIMSSRFMGEAAWEQLINHTAVSEVYHWWFDQVILQRSTAWFQHEREWEQLIRAVVLDTIQELDFLLTTGPKLPTYGSEHSITFEHILLKGYPRMFGLDIGPFPFEGSHATLVRNALWIRLR
tara:strand:- start:1601 stop:1984 length:384 start_codon:yes stop_codon:yes gene_type:complete